MNGSSSAHSARRGRSAFATVCLVVLALLGGSITVARGQDVPAAGTLEGKVVYDASDERVYRYYLVENGVRRLVDPARLDTVREIVAIPPDILAALTEGAPVGGTAVALPPAVATSTAAPTATTTATPGAIGQAAVSTVVAWGTPGPLVAPTPAPTAAGAATAVSASSSPVRPAIQALAVGRNGGTDTAYASTPDGRLYRYAENRASWEELTGGKLTLPAGSSGGALLVTGSDPPIVLYSTSTRSGTAVVNQVSRSTDGGETWSSQTVGDSPARALYQVPGSANTVYMGTNDGVLVSSDAGVSWSPVQNGLPGVGFAVWAIAADPSDAAHLAVGGSTLQGQAQVGGRLFESFDSGRSWAELDYSSVLRAPVLALAFDPAAAGRLLVGLDGDGGLREGAPVRENRTPRFQPIGSSNINRVASLAFRPGTRSGGSPAGSVSTSSGTPVATLVSNASGGYSLPALTPGPYVLQITAPSGGLQLFAGTLPGGVPAVSSASGAVAAAPTPLLAGASGAGVQPTASTSGSSAVGVLVNGGVFLSYDRGLNWADATNGVDVRAVGQVAFSQDGRLIFIGGGAPSQSSAPSPGGVYRGTIGSGS
ncbi:MAG: hypothetical protein HYX52_00820 [Chloroflexi bacterium]|nr:hypothetical protein [Chloroflexota bacterium]